MEQPMNTNMITLDNAKLFQQEALTAYEKALARNLVTALEAIERKDKALLLAARWFKLNFDDETLNDHPPSKADLAGMFDAMQEARAK
jgi:hypothetical protein